MSYLSIPLKPSTLAVALSTALTATAINAQESDEKITVYGNALYDMASSEETGGYAVDSATVGTKTPADLRDIPQSVTVLTNDYIEERNFVALDDLAKNTPALVTQSNDSGRSSIFSRGYEYDELNVNGLPSPMSSIQGNLPSLAAVDRVEIMRGPSGLFNSTSELGGIVNIVLKKPTEEFQGSATAKYGSWNRHYVEGDISGSLSDSGTVRARVVASNGQIRNHVKDNDNLNNNLYAVVDADLSENTLLSTYLLYNTKELTPYSGLPVGADGELLDVDVSTFLGSSWDLFESDTLDFGSSLKHRFENGGVGQFSFRYVDHNYDSEQAITNSRVGNDGAITMTYYGQKGGFKSLSLDTNYSQTFKFFGNVSEFVAGADFKNYDSERADLWDADRFGNPINYPLQNGNLYTHNPGAISKPNADLGTPDNSLSREFGLYAKGSWRLFEPLTIITGARLSWHKTDIDNATGTDYSKSEDATFTPYAGILFELTHAHTAYLSYSEVFKPQTETDSNGKMFDPREGQQFEVGLKSSLFGDMLNSRVSVFQLTDENRVYQDAMRNNLAGGKVEVNGFELEVMGEITENWMAMLGYSHIDINEVFGPENARLGMIPSDTVNLWSDYHLASLVDGLHVGFGATYTSEVEFVGRGVDNNQNPVTVYGAAIRYEISDKLSSALNVYNLTDEKYYNRVAGPTTFNMYAPPVNFMASLNYKF